MHMYIRPALLLTCAWLCAACVAPPMRSDVSVFHQLHAEPRGKTFAFITLEAQRDTPEHKTYCEMVKQHLLMYGMREADDQADSDFLMAIDYFADSPLQLTTHTPAFGQTGVSRSESGTLEPYGVTSMVRSTTTYASSPATSTSAAGVHSSYARGFILLMYETKVALQSGNAKPVYEGRVSAAGSDESLAKVLPVMIKALFQQFPGRSGDMRMALRVP